MSSAARSQQERREAEAARRQRRAEVTDPDIVMQAAAAFVAVRQRSVEETRRRLRHLGYPAALTDEAIDRLVTLGYLDDLAFGRSWVESRDRARPRGTAALRRELEEKGVPADTIAEVLADRDARVSPGDPRAAPRAADADRVAAERLLARRATSLDRETDPRRRRQRAYALLARNGFPPDICHEVASVVVGDEARDHA